MVLRHLSTQFEATRLYERAAVAILIVVAGRELIPQGLQNAPLLPTVSALFRVESIVGRPGRRRWLRRRGALNAYLFRPPKPLSRNPKKGTPSRCSVSRCIASCRWLAVIVRSPRLYSLFHLSTA